MAAITHRPIARTTTKKLAVSAVIILGIIYIIINVLLITREYGVEPPPNMQFYSDTSAVSFCGDGFWSNTEIRCNDRVQYLHETYATTVDEAISSLLKKDECVCIQPKTVRTKNSIRGPDPLPHASPKTAGSITHQKGAANTRNYTTVEDRPKPFSFSACMLIKDSNILLPEWLAYHYTTLPLRRLIVGVDPFSHTDPKPILDLYESIGMNITTWRIWANDSFWVDDGRTVHEKEDFRVTISETDKALRDRYKQRQKVFVESCLQQLHHERRTWTLLVDIDEYFAFNYYDEGEGEPTWCKKNETCAQEYAKSIDDGSHYRAKLDPSPAATVAEHIAKHVDSQFDTVDKPCIIFSRYLFVSNRESDRKEIQKGLDADFNATLFHTFRYRYRAPLWTYQLGKSMVDVSRYNGQSINNIHRPLGGLCTGNNAYVHNAAMSFRVHHYVGSWETFRQPGFDARGKDHFNKRNSIKKVVADNTTPRYSSSENSTWLTEFTKLVGKEKALELTQSIRIREELEMDRVMRELENGKQMYD